METQVTIDDPGPHWPGKSPEEKMWSVRSQETFCKIFVGNPYNCHDAIIKSVHSLKLWYKYMIIYETPQEISVAFNIMWSHDT